MKKNDATNRHKYLWLLLSTSLVLNIVLAIFTVLYMYKASDEYANSVALTEYWTTAKQELEKCKTQLEQQN